MIPLSGAATKGGKLLFCATWSIDAGDGIDDKLVFCTDLGELLIFTGGDPASAANWRQEGRYEVSPPMGMNAHIGIGGDMLIATVDGIVPISRRHHQGPLRTRTRRHHPQHQADVADGSAGQARMAVDDVQMGRIRRAVRDLARRPPGKRWSRRRQSGIRGVVSLRRLRRDLFHQDAWRHVFRHPGGIIMQADRTGYDDGMPYTAILVGGWEVFQSPGQTITWRQARASFAARANEPFAPQLSATTDYVVVLPTPPNAGDDPGVLDLWDQGLWGPNVSGFYPLWIWSHAYGIGDQAYDSLTDNNWTCAIAHSSPASGTFEAYRTANPSHWALSVTQPTPSPVPTTPERDQYAQWDQPTPSTPVVRNTGWVSIGRTGFPCAGRPGNGGTAGQAGSGFDQYRRNVRACRHQRIGECHVVSVRSDGEHARNARQ